MNITKQIQDLEDNRQRIIASLESRKLQLLTQSDAERIIAAHDYALDVLRNISDANQPNQERPTTALFTSPSTRESVYFFLFAYTLFSCASAIIFPLDWVYPLVIGNGVLLIISATCAWLDS